MSNPDYQVTKHEIEGDRLTINVEVASPLVTKAYKKVHKKLLRFVRIPGFRSGKAPMDVVSSRVGPEKFNQEVETELLPKFYYKAVEGEARRPVSEVEYTEKELEKGKPFKFTASVDVACEIELGDYNSLEISEIEAVEVSDEDVQKQLEGLRRRMAQMTKPEENDTIGDSSLVHLRYEGSIDGKAFKTLTQVTSLLVGDDDFLPGFGENIKGMKDGEEKTFTYKMPEDYELEHLASKDVEFKVKIFTFQHAKLPEVSDDFAKEVGAFESLEQLTGKIRGDLDEQAKQKREKNYADKLRELLASVVSCELPEERVEKAIGRRIEDLKDRFQNQPITFEEHLEESGKTEESLREDLDKEVRNEMKVDYALDKIALSEELQVTDEEVEKRIAFTAQVFRRPAAEIKEILDATGSRILRKFDLLREKAFSMLLERYRVKAGLAKAEEKTEENEG